MRKAEGKLHETRARGGHPTLRACLVLGLFAGQFGCSTFKGGRSSTNANTGDPLLGGGAPVSATRSTTKSPPPNVLASNPSAAPVTPVSAPLPAPTGSTSPAALAAGGPGRMLDNGFRIGEPQRQPIATGAPVPPNQPAPTTPGQGAVLRQPLPVPGLSNQGTPPPGASNYGSGRVATDAQAETALAARGVLWQRLETTENGEWRFVCSVPNRQNPNIRRTYEGRAKDKVNAMYAVIEQIDKDKN